MRNRKSGKSKTLLVIGLVFIVVTIFLFFLFMLILDWMAPVISHSIKHNIDGSVWFAVIGSMIMAVPSILVALYAIYQSERVNELQAEKYRPVLALKRAELQTYYIRWPGYQSSDFYKRMGLEEQERINAYSKAVPENNYALLRLNFVVVLKNNLEVNDFEVTCIRFVINGKPYKVRKSEVNEEEDGCHKKIQHKFESEWELYVFDEMLYQFTAEDKKLWDELNKSMIEFSLPNPAYREFEAEIGLRLLYETEESRAENAVLKVCFGNSKGCGDCCFAVSADSGRFSYSDHKVKG